LSRFRIKKVRFNQVDALVNSTINTTKICAQLSCPESIFYFVYVDIDIPIAYLKLNWGTAQTEQYDDDPMEIERIYVLNQYQGKGIGQLLMNKAISVALSKHKKYIWLGVWEKNTKAIAFYKKLGYVIFSEHEFMLGKERQTDIIMKLDLKYHYKQ